MQASERIGVYICECGPNIKDALFLDEVVKFTQGLKNVVLVKRFGLLCSKEGRSLIENEIKEYKLTRLVVAACSPKEHEHTFREVLRKARLNPFFLQIANIREQCAWVIKDRVEATEKTKAIINGAVQRVLYHEPLDIKEIECVADVLVVGAGITGISAALTLVQQNRKVYLVEKLPCIGGKVASYEEIFPNLECASCVLDPLLDEVLHKNNIEAFTLSKVQEVLGSYGNFTVKVNRKARCVDTMTCIGCGVCFEVCPVSVENEYNEGLDERKAIYLPYAGSLPNVPTLDKDHCLHWQKEGCNACEKACPFGSINYEETDQVLDLNVGAIIIATGFDTFDATRAPQYGYGKIANVYTGLEFERLLNSNGPTGGKLLLKNGQTPKKIAFVHCVGSRVSQYNEHCSGICCMYSLKFVHQARQKLPRVSITELHSDLCLPGQESQHFYNMVFKRDDIEFLRMTEPDSIEIGEEDDEILIKYMDVHGEHNMLACDMVVLAGAVEGARDARDVADVFDISQDEVGFFTEGHPSITPVSIAREGLFIAGCAQGPKNIPGSIAEGQAAAGIILSRLVPGEKLTLEATTADIKEDLCSGCKICIGLCSYKAITADSTTEHMKINEILCKGCGLCAAICPSGAIKVNHFTDSQIYTEMRGLVKQC